MSYEFLLFETIGKIAIITLNRHHVLNALSEGLVQDLGTVLERCEENPEIHCIILTGSKKAFSAGLDIQEMQDKAYSEVYLKRIIQELEKVGACRKPLIAAVSGYVLGGGCEIAMMCDIIIASETAQFGQPEVAIGTLPGAGGTQRLVRAVGKAKAMDMCLTDRLMDAHEAERTGLVSRVVPVAQLHEESLKVAEKIAAYSLPVVLMIKEALKEAFETSLREGLKFESERFLFSFSLEDQKEGMAAFLDKRPAVFKGK
ncbi:MAG: enoyl-CoA hydratase/isomerase family protein [Proteobacteria bacterium]|nr:enoyl-CoA hydratase/isomerase family protein [Pseudomonadota bacterium]